MTITTPHTDVEIVARAMFGYASTDSYAMDKARAVLTAISTIIQARERERCAAYVVEFAAEIEAEFAARTREATERDVICDGLVKGACGALRDCATAIRESK